MSEAPKIDYRVGGDLDLDEVIDVYVESTLGARRPVDDRERMARMLAGANLLISAWEGERMVGIARSITDGAYCTYLSDLAVRVSHQGAGIGAELVRRTQVQAGEQATVLLLSAPAAVGFYERIGMERHPAAFQLLHGLRPRDP